MESCDESHLSKEDRICRAFLRNNFAQAGSLEEMNRRNHNKSLMLCAQTSQNAVLCDDSVMIVEQPLETVEVMSSSSYEFVEVRDCQVMTKTPTIRLPNEFKALLADAWCPDKSVLCCDAFELFKMAYCRRHPRLKNNVETKTTTLWRKMRPLQRLPFHAEAFVAHIICGDQPFGENMMRQYFQGVSVAINKRH